MGELPAYPESPFSAVPTPRAQTSRAQTSWAKKPRRLDLTLSLIALFYLPVYWMLDSSPNVAYKLPINSTDILSRCASVKSSPGTPPDFYTRTQSDRFQAGTRPTLLKNATIWTGDGAGNKVINGDILLDGGIIKWIGIESSDAKRAYGQNIDIVDAQGAWLTPGYVFRQSGLSMNLCCRRVKNRRHAFASWRRLCSETIGSPGHQLPQGNNPAMDTLPRCAQHSR